MDFFAWCKGGSLLHDPRSAVGAGIVGAVHATGYCLAGAFISISRSAESGRAIEAGIVLFLHLCEHVGGGHETAGLGD